MTQAPPYRIDVPLTCAISGVDLTMEAKAMADAAGSSLSLQVWSASPRQMMMLVRELRRRLSAGFNEWCGKVGTPEAEKLKGGVPDNETSKLDQLADKYRRCFNGMPSDVVSAIKHAPEHYASGMTKDGIYFKVKGTEACAAVAAAIELAEFVTSQGPWDG